MTSLITLQLIHKIAQIYKSYCYSCKSHKNRVIGIIDFGRSEYHHILLACARWHTFTLFFLNPIYLTYMHIWMCIKIPIHFFIIKIGMNITTHN